MNVESTSTDRGAALKPAEIHFGSEFRLKQAGLSMTSEVGQRLLMTECIGMTEKSFTLGANQGRGSGERFL